MKEVKNLKDVSLEDQKIFFNSFKQVLCDMDGVVWLSYTPLPGTATCINYLNEVGKNVAFVTNNTHISIATARSVLVRNNFSVKELVSPTVAIVNYLKSINFNKHVYVCGSTAFKEDLENEGFTVTKSPPSEHIEEVKILLEHIQDDPNVGAVICEFDPNLSRLKLQKALTLLKRKDVIFITGGGDEVVLLGVDVDPIIGNYHFYKLVEDISGRQPLRLGKPSTEFCGFILNRFNIKDSGSVLFIGDSILADMSFAALAGYQKLLVLTGTTSLDDILNWQHPEEYKPEYYVSSLSELGDILKSVYKLDSVH